MQDRPISKEDYFSIVHNIYSDKANEILIDLDLAHYEDWTPKERLRCTPIEEQKLITHDKLTTGTYQYRVITSEKCKYIPIFPILEVILRSSTNAQAYSHRFMNS